MNHVFPTLSVEMLRDNVLLAPVERQGSVEYFDNTFAPGIIEAMQQLVEDAVRVERLQSAIKAASLRGATLLRLPELHTAEFDTVNESGLKVVHRSDGQYEISWQITSDDPIKEVL
ncbi:hypothetical protein [Lacticaseibacillus saniviri]